MVYEGKYYGTLKSELHRIWDNQQVPVLDIDVKGARLIIIFNWEELNRELDLGGQKRPRPIPPASPRGS